MDVIDSKYDLVYKLSDEERKAAKRGLPDARAGRFASDEKVKALFDRYFR